MEEETERLMAQLPKTAAGFNRDFKALKKNVQQQITYLRKIPLQSIKSFFVKTEVETATFAEIMRTLAESVNGAEDAKWAGDFMMALSTASKFDTTIMFAEDEEVENI